MFSPFLPSFSSSFPSSFFCWGFFFSARSFLFTVSLRAVIYFSHLYILHRRNSHRILLLVLCACLIHCSTNDIEYHFAKSRWPCLSLVWSWTLLQIDCLFFLSLFARSLCLSRVEKSPHENKHDKKQPNRIETKTFYGTLSLKDHAALRHKQRNQKENTKKKESELMKIWIWQYFLFEWLAHPFSIVK